MTDFVELILQKIKQIILQENQGTLPKKIAVATSGGSDSMALTFLLQEFCRQNKMELFSVTVNHKIRQSSDSEVLWLNRFLEGQKITHRILEIAWQSKPRSNIEAKMREARYQLLQEFCRENKIKYLFLGHQLDDVAENFLIRLFRGSGLDGLSTMAEVSSIATSVKAAVHIVRPLLNVSKNELQKFLTAKKIKWLEDESNNDEKFLRNKIRNFLNSFDEEDLIKKRIKSASDELARMRDLFDLEMLDQAKKILQFEGDHFLLNLKKFKKVEKKIALKILALVAMEMGEKAYKPRLERLKVFYDWVINDKNYKARDFYGCVAKGEGDWLRVSNSKNKVELRTLLRTLYNKTQNY